jgi:hypothetical protein
MIGQLVSSQLLGINTGDNSVILNVQSMTSGSYTAVIETGEQNFSKMLIVSK